MIEAIGLTKRYGDRLAVDHLTFSIQPGQVTGLLGPNGAGKSTTMRMILGLDAPTAGTVTIDGKPFATLANPMREVGALLDAKATSTVANLCAGAFGGAAKDAELVSLRVGQHDPTGPVRLPQVVNLDRAERDQPR
jgi:ABC-type sulfate/molybdate transport systems ATPase subunit